MTLFPPEPAYSATPNREAGYARTVVDDTADAPAIGSDDPADDYLIALAETTRSFIVTGDSDLLITFLRR